ncbi:MAG: ATP-binding protein [Rickettsiaceae bacterium]|nr:ATP-binding protein [Rickettsiaceae bacterium]
MIQNKHIIRFSFIGLFIYIVANILLNKYFIIEEVVLKKAAAQSTHMVETYQTNVWNNHANAINKINKQGRKSLFRDEDFINFVKTSNDFLKNIDMHVTIYNQSGKKILTNYDISLVDINKYNGNSYYDNVILNLDKYLLKDYIYDQAISEAFRGKTVHSLILSAVVIDKENNKSQRSFIHSYIPIIDSDMGKFSIEGVIEITIDITEQWDNISYLEKRIFIGCIIVFLMFFIIVMYNTHYAQRVINKQFETNIALEEAKTRAELESSSKTEFLANISHELRTPLNAIIGFSEIILSENSDKTENKRHKDYIGDINYSGKHLLSVINDILDFSKASADKLTVDAIELNINKLAAASMRFVKPRADKAGIELIENFPQEHVIIKADQKRLKQALLNLLSNSVKFTPKKGSVTLSITKDTNEKLVYIIVSDTGIGMSSQDIPKALSSFGQVDNSLSRRYEGTGLGLPLTKKLIELMGGEFNLESVEGEGTKVTIIFGYTDSIEL